MKHSNDDALPRDVGGPHADLLALLDYDEQPDPGLQQRFEARLGLDAATPASVRQGSVGKLFQRYWPSRPFWAFAYSCCLLSAGLLAGQWLPGSMETAPQSSSALVCPVLSSPHEWLPALDAGQLA